MIMTQNRIYTGDTELSTRAWFEAEGRVVAITRGLGVTVTAASVSVVSTYDVTLTVGRNVVVVVVPRTKDE